MLGPILELTRAFINSEKASQSYTSTNFRGPNKIIESGSEFPPHHLSHIFKLFKKIKSDTDDVKKAFELEYTDRFYRHLVETMS